jgi:hypothetical protein
MIKAMLFTTNINKENIYWDCNSKIPQSLNASLQEALGLKPLITLIIFFRILKIWMLKEELPHKIMS